MKAPASVSGILLASLLLSSSVVRAQSAPATPALKVEQVEALARSVESELSRYGLVFEPAVAVRALPHAALVAAAAAELESEAPKGAFEAQRRLRDAFGLATPATDAELLQLVAAARAEQYVIRYDRKLGALVYDAERALDRAALERELPRQLVLAWREHVTPLAKSVVAPFTSEGATLQRALRAGEAEALSLRLSEARAGRPELQVDSEALGAPLKLNAVDPLTALVHEYGRNFMLRRAKQESWAGLASAYDSPPNSTEQVMQIEKLYRDQPRPVSFPEWSAAAGVVGVDYDDQLGELGLLAILLESGADPALARLAASGWDGDRMLIVRNAGGESAQIWRLFFDRGEDVKQFADLWRNETSGRLITRAVTVDWVRSDSVTFADRLGDDLLAAPPNLKPSPEDRESTAAAEKRMLASLVEEPTLSGGRWRVPQFDFSMPAPESWTVDSFNGAPYLMAPQIGRYKDNVSITAVEPAIDADVDAMLERQTRIITQQENLELKFAEKRTIDGREGVYLQYSGSTGEQKLEFAVVMFVRNGAIVAVTTSVSEETWPMVATMIDVAYRGIEIRAGGSRGK